MSSLHEASFYEQLPDGRVHCTLCPHDCHIAEGSRGACSVRYNDGGILYTLVYDRIVASNLEPIEKKPFFHVMPGSLAYSIATVGCNQQCAFCQNWEIAQWPRDELPHGWLGIITRRRSHWKRGLKWLSSTTTGSPRSDQRR